MTRQPVIEHVITAELRQISKVPDARYKSGYRDYKVLHSVLQVMQPGQGATLSIQAVNASPKGYEQMAAYVPIEVGKLETAERLL